MADEAQIDQGIWSHRHKQEKVDLMYGGKRSEAYACTGNEYKDAFNLNDELADLEGGALILDAGTGTGEGCDELQKDFPHLRFVGINAHLLKSQKNLGIPVIQGHLETLTKDTKATLQAQGLWPPTVIMMKDVAHYPATDDTLGNVLEEAHNALRSGGKLLIYNSFKEYPPKAALERQKVIYSQIKETNDELGLFDLQSIETNCAKGDFLKLTKI